MKNVRQLFGIILSSFVVFASYGQEVDDMYFNSKDRAKLNEGKITADLGLSKRNTGITEAGSPINPTDSYSARNINPEYTSQINDGSQPVIEDDYFIQDFQPTGINQNISNCNCSSGTYYNPSAISSFNNPYYGMGGSYYPSYGYGGYPSYGGFNSGLSMSLGYGWGGYNSGFYGGMGYGYGNYGGSFWNPYSPWGNYYGPGYYPGQVIIINNGDAQGTRVSYSKRASRSSDLNYSTDNTRSNYVGPTKFDGRATVTSGRSQSATPEYYDRGWKQNQNSDATRGYWNNNMNTGTNSNNRTGYNQNNSNSNLGGRQGSDFSNPSRGSFDSGSGGSRSGSSGSGSSGGSTRSRSNN